jgi:hypothetical protein
MIFSSLEFQSWDRFVFRPSEMERLSEYYHPDLLQRVDDCHIYLICKKPRVLISSIVKNDSGCEIEIQFKRKGITSINRFSISQEELNSIAGFKVDSIEISEYPHSDLILKYNGIEENSIIFDIMGFFFTGLPDELRLLEIVYVGRSDKSANDRLENHKTLQRVLGEANAVFIDDTILCAVFNFPGSSNSTATRSMHDLMSQKSRQIHGLKLSIKHITDLVEACLISYFKPKYNEIYKTTFPKENHKILQQVTELGINTLSVNLCTSQILLRTFSQAVAPEEEHFFQTNVDFVNQRSFFDFFKLYEEN